MSTSTARSPDAGGIDSQTAERFDLLDCLAVQALNQVAERTRAHFADPDESALERLHAAATGQDAQACSAVARALISEGLTAERVCDVHIPATVDRLGEEWVTGDLPFSTVTIGSARLQGLLRELDLNFSGCAERAAGSAGAILLVIPAGADHTLGPLVLASQLRRKGFSVRLSLGEAAEAVAEATRKIRFDAVFLSATLARSLPHLARTAAAIRAATPAPPPVVLGGAIVASSGLAKASLGDMIDAADGKVDLSAIDHVTCDLEEAMRLCGLDFADRS